MITKSHNNPSGNITNIPINFQGHKCLTVGEIGPQKIREKIIITRGNGDLSSNDNARTKFYTFFCGHFEFRWIIFIMTD